MLLKEKCPTCDKEIKSILTQFESMGKLHLVYNCGHLCVKPVLETVSAASRPNTNSNGHAALVQEDFTCPEPTKKELYEDLDRWVSEGGAYKKSPEQIAYEEYWNSYFTDPVWNSLDKSGDKARPYQFEGTRFIEKTRIRGLI